MSPRWARRYDPNWVNRFRRDGRTALRPPDAAALRGFGSVDTRRRGIVVPACIGYESAHRFVLARTPPSGLAVDLPGLGEYGACVRWRGVPRALPSRGAALRRYCDAGFVRITSQFVCRAVDGWGMPSGFGVSEVSLNQPSLQPPISRLRAASAPRLARSRAKD